MNVDIIKVSSTVKEPPKIPLPGVSDAKPEKKSNVYDKLLAADQDEPVAIYSDED